MEKDSLREERELVFIDPQPVPAFRFTETTTMLTVTTKGMKALIDKQTGAITFTDHTGKVFLREKPGSRKLLPSQVMGQPCFVAEQKVSIPRKMNTCLGLVRSRMDIITSGTYPANSPR